MRERIDAKQFCEMVIHAAVSVDACKQDINELNVFPVPDGDTGTNMSMTLNAAARELEETARKIYGEGRDKAGADRENESL